MDTFGTNDRGYRYSRVAFDVLSLDGYALAGYSTLADALEGMADEETIRDHSDWKGSDTDNREFYFEGGRVVVVLEERQFRID